MYKRLALVALFVVAVVGVGTLGTAPRHRNRTVTRVVRRVAHRARHGGLLLARTVERVAAQDRPLYCGGHRGRYVALTFDDGPGAYTHLALRILRADRARATFFVVGRNLARFPGFVQKELALGVVGDHTWTHRYLPSLTSSAIAGELSTTQRAIEQRVARKVVLFRPPYGARSASIDRAADSLGMLDVLWSVDSLDWKGANWRQIAENVMNNLRPGSIVLMHENRGQTIRGLHTLLLPALRARHWKLVTVPQLLALDPPSARQLREGLGGCLGTRRPAAA
jgi:peptidoglycan/xylan/chitin deacetylase (PgdA/CDA1 family)